MHLEHKIFSYFWICAVAFSNEINETDSEIIRKDGRPTYAIHNTCGGYVEAKLDQIVVIEYKLNQEYDNDEFCVWEIRHGEVYASLITKVTSGFEVGYDYLQVSSFLNNFLPPSNNHLIGNITGMEQVNANGHFSFLVFSTDYSNTGTGFRLEIIGYDARNPKRVYEDFVTVSPIGSVALWPYKHSMTESYLIVPKLKTVRSLVLDLKYNTEIGYDYLSVYSMERNGQTIKFRNRANKWSGNGTGSFRTDYYTNFIVFFNSDTDDVPDDAGYELNWYEPDNLPTPISS